MPWFKCVFSCNSEAMSDCRRRVLRILIVAQVLRRKQEEGEASLPAVVAHLAKLTALTLWLPVVLSRSLF